MAHGNVPWWVNAIYKVGVPTAIACYLVYILAGKVTTGLEAIDARLAIHVEQQIIHNGNEEKQLQLLRVICSQGAKNATERRECFQ